MHFFNSSITSFLGNVKGVHISSSCLFIILDVMLATAPLLICLQVNSSAVSLSVLNLDMHMRPNLPSLLLSASSWYLKQEKAPKRGPRLRGAITHRALFAIPAVVVVPLRPRITEIPHESFTFSPSLSLQVSYLYKHFLGGLSSQAAQELEHNLTEQTIEPGDLWFLWVRLQVVFVPVKQWK